MMQELFKKYLQGQCTPEELAILMGYFDNPENELLLKQLIMAELQNTATEQAYPIDIDSRLNNIQHRLQQHLSQESSQTGLWQKWRKVAAAAAVLLLIGSAVLYYKNIGKPVVDITAMAKNVSHGKNAAILILADGSRIVLSDAAQGQLAKQGDVSITQTAKGQIVYQQPSNTQPAEGNIAYNQLSTANGEQYAITLPDGSTVTLNSASAIKYPSSFAGLTERKIELTGEAYFVVKHDDQHPFKVIANGLQVEDVGTEFNINSYADEGSVKATLVSGAASVSSAQHDNFLLAPAQQAVFNGTSFKVISVDPEVFIGWKKGVFVYKNTSLQEVMRQVARWYNLQVVYEQNELKTKRLSGSVSRYDDVAGILNAIGYTAKVKFRLENRQITVLTE